MTEEVVVRSPGRGHVVVIGAGAAGCLAARILSESFSRVTVIERDRDTSATCVRRGLPQGHHVHNVLFRGNEIIAELFPGFFGHDFDRVQAPRIHVALEQRMLGPFGWSPQYETGLWFRGYSRAFLDDRLRRAIQDISNIEIVIGDVQALLVSEKKDVVTGIRFADRATRAEREMACDLVVDVSGRGTRMDTWLEALGIESARKKLVAMPEGYTTLSFELTKDRLPAWRQYAELRIPGVRNRGVYMLAMEDGRWIVTLVGVEGDQPALTVQGFLDWTRGLSTETVAELLKDSKPIGEVRAYRNMDCVCRFYDEQVSLPKGLIALGDSLCTLNPTFGQGMTAAAEGVLILRKELTRATPGWERRFHRKVIDCLSQPWLYTVRDDLRDDFISRRPKLKALRKRYRLWALRTLFQLIPSDPAAHFLLFEVQNLMRPLSTLFRPWNVAIWKLRLRLKKEPAHRRTV